MRRNLTRSSFTIGLGLLLLVGVGLRAASFAWNTRLQGDINLFALTAREFVQHDRLYYPMKAEFSDHVAYKTLASPASQHPPLWPFAAGLLGKVLRTDNTFPLLKFLSEAIGIGLLLVVAYAGVRRRRPVETVVALALVALSPDLVDYSANGSPYILSAALLVLAALLMERFRTERLTDYALAGVLCGVALQAHSVLILLPVAFVIFWIGTTRRIPWKGLAIAGAAGLVTLVPWMLWSYSHFHTPFYSSSTSFILGQFGLEKMVVAGDVVTKSIVRSADAGTLVAYLRGVGQTAAYFASMYRDDVGLFCLVLLVAGWVGLLRHHRRAAFASLVPFVIYTLTVILWATARDRFVVPIIPLTYLVAAAGFAFLLKNTLPWRILGWVCLIGTIAWSLAGYRDQPPTRYYRADAEWAATYGKMLPLAQELGKLERGVVMGYTYILDGGMETVYWDRQPFVDGREMPPEALTKVVEDFGVRYLWTQSGTYEDVLARFPRAREVLANGPFHVLELPSFELAALTPEQQAAAVRAAGPPDVAALAPLAATVVRPIEDQAWFGDQVRLAGSAVERWEGDLLVDLAWVTTSSKLPPLQYFVHVTDGQGRLVAQHDGPLGRWPDQPESGWAAGSLLRQRIRLQLPPEEQSGPYRIFVGLNASQTGERLPLKVNGATLDDAYLLTMIGSE